MSEATQVCAGLSEQVQDMGPPEAALVLMLAMISCAKIQQCPLACAKVPQGLAQQVPSAGLRPELASARK